MTSILAAESQNPLIPPLGEIIVGTITFAIAFFVLAKFVWPRLEQVFRARREAIEGGIERAEALQAEAKASLEQYRAQLAEARNEAAQIRGKVVGESLADDARRRGTVDRFLAELDGMAAGDGVVGARETTR